MPEYKIEAFSETDKPHTILTQERGRALRYVAGLSAMRDYHRVTVTVSGKTYEGDSIRGQMP